MRTTISDLWLVTHDDTSVNIRAPLFDSLQIEREVRRANMEHRDGRTDWMAVDLEEVILVYGESKAANAINGLLRDMAQTRH
jgi:hypothetical protein